jgi:serine/threonine-protein kinase
MPYARGESLREWLEREHQLPVDEAVMIATKVAGALQAAHEQGVIHRDIKPANILLARGEPVVADFGIALAVRASGGDRLTQTGTSIGSPHYMSPEQVTGEREIGPATDIYALGCVLYESLVGEPPFTGLTPQSIVARIVTGESSRVREERKSVRPNVDAAISRALERLVADRFKSASKFAEALNDSGFRHRDEVVA